MIEMQYNKHASLLLALVLNIIAGCGEDGATGGDVSGKATEGSESDYPRLVWTGVGSDGGVLDASGSPVVAEMMRGKFQEIDWSRAEAVPSIAILMEPGRSLKIGLFNEPVDGRLPIVAFWSRTEVEGQTEVSVLRRSDPLPDPDAALALLLSYLEAEGEWDLGEGWAVISRGTSATIKD